MAQSLSSHVVECVVCGSQDARILSSTALSSGATVVVCGSHALAHGRQKRPARSVSELRAVLTERRSPSDRRASVTDELAQSLTLAFNADCRDGAPSGRRLSD